MKLDVSSRHCFSAEKPQSIHMTKMGVCNEQMIDAWIVHHSKLASKIACGFNEKGCSIIGFDSKRYWAPVILFRKSLATWPCTPWLRTASVLGDSEECHNRHDASKCSCHIDIFRGKTSSETSVWIDLTGLWHDQRKYPSLARNRGCECVEQSTRMMRLRSGLDARYDNFSKILMLVYQR